MTRRVVRKSNRQKFGYEEINVILGVTMEFCIHERLGQILLVNSKYQTNVSCGVTYGYLQLIKLTNHWAFSMRRRLLDWKHWRA